MNRIGFIALIITQFVLALPSLSMGQGTVCPVPCSLEPGDWSEQEQSATVRNATDELSSSLEPSESLEVRKSIKPVGTGTGLWDWSDAGPHHDSIVEISSEAGAGTGVLISADRTRVFKKGHIGHVLTAWHVIKNDIVNGKLKVRYRNRTETRDCTVIRHSEEKDIAIVRVWVPQGIQEARLASAPIKRGDRLELVGLGGGTNLTNCVRAFKSSASPPSSGDKIFADVPLLPGDSGGPIFNSSQEVVGVISGGWFWWDSGVTSPDGAMMRTTWPARASNVAPIRRMLEGLKKSTNIADAASTLTR
ncbi:MAG: trypsin-like peptidase domain-containing protein [Planctomycetaceae bacterium]|nr:trypsin-like peptidase domain-containing protein [Planctomycetaceae bacterium]